MLSPAIDIIGFDKAMSYFPLKQRLKIALGGFLSLAGFIILLLAILTTTGTVNLENVVKTELIVAVALIVGIFDIICGLFLFWKK